MSNINDAIDAVETALALIKKSSGYNNELGSSEFIAPESIDEVTGAEPRVYITGCSDEVERFSYNKLFRRLTVNIQGITAALHYRAIQDQAGKLWDDIETALYSDTTLGGKVSTLRYVAGEMTFQRETNHGVIDMQFELDIHYTEGSP